MTFTITRLANAQALVSGTDRFGNQGQTVLNTARYDEVQRELAYLQAKDSFDNKVEEFFSELTEAAEELQQATTLVPVEDPASFVEVRPARDCEPGDPGVRLSYDNDGTILNLIHVTGGDRLVWLNGDTLLVTEYVAPEPVVDQSETVPVNGAGEEENSSYANNAGIGGDAGL